jgi:predicted nucleic acid-binding protein
VAEENHTVVVTDTTPLNYLVLIGQIDILPQLFTQVLVPAAVMTELRHPEAPATVRTWANVPTPHWLEIREPKALEPALEFLGPGERAAIALAQETGADALLIDERTGRREAERRHLRVIGTLAVLEEAGRRGLLDFGAALEQLRQTSFRLSPFLLRALSEPHGSKN